VTVFGLWASSVCATPLSPSDATSHIGQPATVCGEVASTKYDSHVRSRPTFLDFGKPYPDEIAAYRPVNAGETSLILGNISRTER
jgi:hypothetical protein